MDTNAASSLVILLFGIIILFGVFLILRQFSLWYFRINETIEIMKRQEKILEKIASNNSTK